MRRAALLLSAGVLSAALSGCDRAAAPAWTWSGEGPSRSGLYRLPNGVLFGNEAGALVRLDADGELRWSTQVGREIAARPTVVDQTVIAATVGGEWVGVELESGNELWRVGDKPVLFHPLASDARRVFAVAPDGSVLAFSPQSGGTVWKRVPPRTGSGSPQPSPSGGPVVLGDRVIVGLGSAGLFALEPEFGEVLWRKGDLDVLGFLGESERIYVLTRAGTMLALRAEDGVVEWERPLMRPVGGGPYLARGLLWVATAGVGLVAVDPQDGRETWHVKLPAPLHGGVGEYRELILVPTSAREGRLLGYRPGREAPIVDVRADSALRSEPVLFGATVLVQASDGRVLSWNIRRTTP